MNSNTNPRPATNGQENKRVERFWRFVNKDGPVVRPELGPCWVWKGVMNLKGKEGREARAHRGVYGIVAIHKDGKRTRMHAHRFAWIITNGEIPEGLFACHKCDNPECVRPEHLFLGTPKANTRDAIAKGRNSRGKEHGLKVAIARANPRPKREEPYRPKRWVLTPETSAKILARRAEGASYRGLAKEFGVAQNTIAKLIRESKQKAAA